MAINTWTYHNDRKQNAGRRVQSFHQFWYSDGWFLLQKHPIYIHKFCVFWAYYHRKQQFWAKLLCRRCSEPHTTEKMTLWPICFERKMGTRGALNLFWWVCATRVSKVGSREHILLEKWGVLGTKILKICVFKAEILAKNKPDNAKLFLKLKMGGIWVAHWW